MSHLLIRADATSTIGTGHVMRCLALALAAQAEGINVRMVCRLGVDWLVARFAKENLPVTSLDARLPERESPEILLQQLAEGAQGAPPSQSWVVLDGYHFGLDCQKAVREAGYKLLVIDDYAHLPEYSCDVLLNQNIGAEKFQYQGDIGQKLLGLRYVLLRPEFLAAREKAKARVFPETPQHILLTLGGGDSSPYLRCMAHHFAVPEMQGRVLRVIAGAMSNNAVFEYLRDCPASIEILRNVENMPALLLDTDLCITAGGSTCWELCCLRVPFLVVEIAKNQHAITKNLFHADKNILFSARNMQNKMCRLNAEQSFLVDGKGANLVARALYENSLIRPTVSKN